MEPTTTAPAHLFRAGAGPKGAGAMRRPGRWVLGSGLVAALLGAGCGSGSGSDEVAYREVVLELLRSPERLEVKREPARNRVRIETVSPLRSVGSGAGNRPALILPPGSEAVFDLPDLGPGTSLALSVGLSWDDHEDARGTAKFIGLLDGRVVLREEVAIGGPKAERGGWIDHRIDVSGGGALSLRCISEVKGLRSSVAGLTVERTRRVPAARSTPEAPNLVLVVVDTLRSDRVSAYGYGRPTAPALEALAARGVLWEDAWSVAPWTWPSTASILTGEEPPEHGVLDRFSCYLADESTTLAEHMRAAGCATVGFSSNPLISVWQNFGQGFEQFESEDWTRSATFIEPALARLADFGERRFLLYLHLTDPHLPYQPEPDLRERFVSAAGPGSFGLADFGDVLRGGDPDDPLLADALAYISQMYDAEVAASDRAIERVVDRLAELGLDDRTIVVVTSDHGEELLEHGQLGHSHQLFRESLIVPLIAAGPGLPAGRRVSTPVQNHRLLPSLLEWLDLPATAGLPAPLPLDDTAAAAPALHFGTEVGEWLGEGTSSRLLARREGDEFVLWMPEGERLALFDTAADPAETVDVAAERADAATRARALLERWWERRETDRPPPLAGGEETVEMLRALGYLNDE